MNVSRKHNDINLEIDFLIHAAPKFRRKWSLSGGKLHRNYTWIRKPQYSTYCSITNIPTTTIVCPNGMCNPIVCALRIQ